VSLITAIGCYGNHCDDVEVTCRELPEKVVGTPRWTGWFSEESAFDDGLCGRDEWVTALDCANAYCDDMRVECSKVSNVFYGSEAAAFSHGPPNDQFTPFFGIQGETQWLNGGFAIGLQCMGPFCDSLSVAAEAPARAGSFASSSWNPSAAGNWDDGFLKATCPTNATQFGLSINQNGDKRANRAVCRGDLLGSQTRFHSDVAGQVVVNFVTPMDQRLSRRHAQGSNATDDWDPGFIKLECGAKQHVSGSSQSADGKFHSIRCSTLTSAPPHSSSEVCTANVFVEGDSRAGIPVTDWDPSHFKGECAQDGYVTGVSLDASFHPHAILCCG
jgi:hypothetical protein